jgi:hypothetical protein
LENKFQQAVANVTPPAVFDEQHRRMAEPGGIIDGRAMIESDHISRRIVVRGAAVGVAISATPLFPNGHP